MCDCFVCLLEACTTFINVYVYMYVAALYDICHERAEERIRFVEEEGSGGTGPGHPAAAEGKMMPVKLTPVKLTPVKLTPVKLTPVLCHQ